MRSFVLLASALGASSCASTVIAQRAAADLKCPDSRVVVERGLAGAVRATGCGDWIEYSCIENPLGLFCMEDRRAHDLPGTHRRPLTPQTGAEFGACFGNQTCFAPLACVQGSCVRPGSARELAGPCFLGECQSGLECIHDRCEPSPPAPRAPVGTLSGACYQNESCNAGLRCVGNTCYDEATAPQGPP